MLTGGWYCLASALGCSGREGPAPSRPHRLAAELRPPPGVARGLSRAGTWCWGQVHGVLLPDGTAEEFLAEVQIACCDKVGFLPFSLNMD